MDKLTDKFYEIIVSNLSKSNAANMIAKETKKLSCGFSLWLVLNDENKPFEELFDKYLKTVK